MRLQPLGGLVFLDSALTGSEPQPLSILAAAPERILRGNIHRSDADALRDCLAAGAHDPAVDWGLPNGGLLGGIDFDGQFTFGLYRNMLVHRHDTGEWFETGDGSLSAAASEESPAAPPPPPTPAFTPDTTRDAFLTAVAAAKEYIAAGDIYQVNLAHRFSARWDEDWNAFALYESLRDISPAPYAAFFELDGRTVLSSSPESFLRLSGAGIRTRPIKGTRPRFDDLAADEKSAYDLITSRKEVAELIMITDLERNDLGRICQFGSVRVPELLKLERYAQVFHLVSTVEGTLRDEIDPVTAVALCSPGGSISGAPKIRALEIINELEGVPRGLYTGSIGYLGFNGESHFNIAIRTAVIEDGHVRFHVGAGIVADSDPVREYEETLHKASGLLKAARNPAPLP
jgi:para-aminobenzoate synthetase component 1